VGRSLSTGEFRFETTVGTHRISSKKDNYKESPPVEANVSDGNETTVPLVLEWAGGYLTVSASPTDAVITVEPLGRFERSLPRMPAPAGSYAVSVSAPFATSQTRQVTIAAGEDANVAVNLGPDPAKVTSGLAAAAMAIDSERYAPALAPLRAILAVDPGSADALSTLASLLYHQGQLDSQNRLAEYTEAANRALAAGGRIRFLLLHHHGVPPELHPVTVWIGAGEFRFDPAGSESCALKTFAVPLANVLNISLPEPNYIELKVRDGSNKTRDMKLAERHAEMATKDRKAAIVVIRSHVIAGKPDSQAALNAVIQTIAASKARPPAR